MLRKPFVKVCHAHEAAAGQVQLKESAAGLLKTKKEENLFLPFI